MKKISLALFLALTLSACSFTITRTEVNVYHSSGAEVEVLQEQKSDTAQTQELSASMKSLW